MLSCCEAIVDEENMSPRLGLIPKFIEKLVTFDYGSRFFQSLLQLGDVSILVYCESLKRSLKFSWMNKSSFLAVVRLKSSTPREQLLLELPSTSLLGCDSFVNRLFLLT